jgi:hypothetical protein
MHQPLQPVPLQSILIFLNKLSTPFGAMVCDCGQVVVGKVCVIDQSLGKLAIEQNLSASWNCADEFRRILCDNYFTKDLCCMSDNSIFLFTWLIRIQSEHGVMTE